jgi:hypothetical protein
LLETKNQMLLSQTLKYKKLLVMFFAVTSLFITVVAITPVTVSAQQTDPCEEFKKKFQASNNGQSVNLIQGLPAFCNVGQLYTKVINIVLAIAGSVVVIFLIIGGFQYLTAAGNEEQIEKGKKTLVNSVIGLVIIIMAFAIVRIVSNLLLSGVEGQINNTNGTNNQNQNNNNNQNLQVVFSGAQTASADSTYGFTITVPDALVKQVCGSAPNVSGFVNVASPGQQSNVRVQGTVSKDAQGNTKVEFGLAAPKDYGISGVGAEMDISFVLCGQNQGAWAIPVTSSQPAGGGSTGDTEKQAAADRSTFTASMQTDRTTIVVNINATSSDKLKICGIGSFSRISEGTIEVLVNGQSAGADNAAASTLTVDLPQAVTSSQQVLVKICGYTIGGGAQTVPVPTR